MNAIRNILILISLIVGLAASTAVAEEQVDVVFGPEVPTAEKQIDTDGDPKAAPSTEADEENTADTAESGVDPMFLVKQIFFSRCKDCL